MTTFRKIKPVVLIFAFLVLFTGAFTIMSADSAQAERCDCWVMVCTVNPPSMCWEICVPCWPILP